MLISQSGPWAGLSFSTVLLQKVGFFNYKKDENMDNGILDTSYAPQNLFLGDNLGPEKNNPFPTELKRMIVRELYPFLG